MGSVQLQSTEDLFIKHLMFCYGYSHVSCKSRKWPINHNKYFLKRKWLQVGISSGCLCVSFCFCCFVGRWWWKNVSHGFTEGTPVPQVSYPTKQRSLWQTSSESYLILLAIFKLNEIKFHNITKCWHKYIFRVCLLHAQWNMGVSHAMCLLLWCRSQS